MKNIMNNILLAIYIASLKVTFICCFNSLTLKIKFYPFYFNFRVIISSFFFIIHKVKIRNTNCYCI